MIDSETEMKELDRGVQYNALSTSMSKASLQTEEVFTVEGYQHTHTNTHTHTHTHIDPKIWDMYINIDKDID